MLMLACTRCHGPVTWSPRHDAYSTCPVVRSHIIHLIYHPSTISCHLGLISVPELLVPASFRIPFIDTRQTYSQLQLAQSQTTPQAHMQAEYRARSPCVFSSISSTFTSDVLRAMCVHLLTRTAWCSFFLIFKESAFVMRSMCKYKDEQVRRCDPVVDRLWIGCHIPWYGM